MASVHPHIAEIADRLRAISLEVTRLPVLPDENEPILSKDGFGFPAGIEDSVRRASCLYQERRRRDRIFQDFDLFGEPAWDMLLDLFVMQACGRKVSVISSCIASGSPQTTALRYLNKLEDGGLISAMPDPFDRRRRLIELTPSGMDLVREALA